MRPCVDPDEGRVHHTRFEASHTAIDILPLVKESKAMAVGDVPDYVESVALEPVVHIHPCTLRCHFAQAKLKDGANAIDERFIVQKTGEGVHALELPPRLCMSLDIPVREHRPAVGRGMFPAFVPARLGHLRSNAVDGLIGLCNAVHFWSEAYDGGVEGSVFGILAVERDVIPMSLTFVDAVEVPEFREAGKERAWDGAEGRS